MDSIITYLLAYNQYLIKIIYQLILFISKHIPLKQMAFDDSNSPEYQKFKVDKLPKILKFKITTTQKTFTYKIKNPLLVPNPENNTADSNTNEK